MKKFTSCICNNANSLVLRARTALSNQRGDFYISDAVKIIIAVVLGALLLAALTLIFNDTRTIPILYPEVAEQLRALIEVMDALYPEDLVMNGYHGFIFRNRSGYFLSAHNINRAIERISIAYNAEEMDQAELEDREPSLLPHFSVHNLRHTFCTRLCESTNDIKFIQQVMGHADFSTTMDIYTHITQENMKEKAEVIKGNLVLM